MKSRVVVACLLGIMVFHDATATTVTNIATNATLSTSSGASIHDTNVAHWIKQYIPTNSKKLVVLTQCYGGNMVNKFDDDPNTAVISGTSPGQLGIYGGYDDGTSRGLRPGPGRTAQDIHNAGVDTRNRRETPMIGGGLNPSNFPMDHASSTGAVRSRHVVFYAGKPENRPGRDTDQDVRLKNNFKDEPNTTYEAVAGSTAGGWDQNGNAAGLRKAIENAGAAITNSATPDQEQFILYVTDHGDFHVTAYVNTIIPFGPPVTFSNFPAFQFNAISPEGILRDPGSTPGFSIFIPFPPGGDHVHIVNEPYVPFFPTGWQLIVTPEIPGPPMPVLLPEFIELPFDLDNNIVGDFPGEGLVLFFPVEKQFFVDSFFDVFLTIEIVNTTPEPWLVGWISQDSGEIAKPGSPMVEIFEHVPDNPTGPFFVGWGGYDPVRLEFSPSLDPQNWIPMTPYLPGGPLHEQFFDIPFDFGLIRAAEQDAAPP